MINLSSLIKTSQIFIKTVHFRVMSKNFTISLLTVFLSLIFYPVSLFVIHDFFCYN